MPRRNGLDLERKREKQRIWRRNRYHSDPSFAAKVRGYMKDRYHALSGSSFFMANKREKQRAAWQASKHQLLPRLRQKYATNPFYRLTVLERSKARYELKRLDPAWMAERNRKKREARADLKLLRSFEVRRGH